MRNVLLAAAATLALALPAAPATAQFWHGIGQQPPTGALGRMPNRDAAQHSDRWSTQGSWDGHGDGRWRGRTDVVMDWYGGEWALYNNRSWQSDSYNDWWHDRPDRAYPRWVTQNQGCERMWFSGDVLHC